MKQDKNIPVPSTVELQKTWSSLSNADREVFLGHSKEELSSEDAMKLMRILASLRVSRRK